VHVNPIKVALYTFEKCVTPSVRENRKTHVDRRHRQHQQGNPRVAQRLPHRGPLKSFQRDRIAKLVRQTAKRNQGQQQQENPS
jgi:hypothetical protein